MKRVVTVGVSTLVVLAVVGAILYLRVADGPDTSAVEEIIETYQTYSGEHLDKLVALGPDAVPAIGETLSGEAEFPLVLVQALGEIGDPRGAEPVLKFIEGMAPFESTESSTLTALTIRALRSIPTRESCAPLLEIMRSRYAHPRVRLASAGTLARVCEGEGNGAEEATDILLNYYDERLEFFANPDEGFVESELFDSLAQANDPRVSEIILGIMNSTYSLNSIRSIVEFAQRQPSEDFANALLTLLDDRELALSMRLDIARGLLNRADQPSDRLTSSIGELQLEAETYGYPQELIEEARQLSRAAEFSEHR